MESSKLFPIRKTTGTTVWQHNYYEHIIRDQKAFQNISNYIYRNPQKWDKDRFILIELIRKTYLTSQI